MPANSSLCRVVIENVFHFSTQLLELVWWWENVIRHKSHPPDRRYIFFTIRIFKFPLFMCFTNLNKVKNKIDRVVREWKSVEISEGSHSFYTVYFLCNINPTTLLLLLLNIHWIYTEYFKITEFTEYSETDKEYIYLVRNIQYTL